MFIATTAFFFVYVNQCERILLRALIPNLCDYFGFFLYMHFNFFFFVLLHNLLTHIHSHKTKKFRARTYENTKYTCKHCNSSQYTIFFLLFCKYTFLFYYYCKFKSSCVLLLLFFACINYFL